MNSKEFAKVFSAELVVAPSYLHNSLLKIKETDFPLSHTKLVTKEDLKDKLWGKLSPYALQFLLGNKLVKSYDEFLRYKPFLIYKNPAFSSITLQNTVQLHNELEKNDLITKDDLFLNQFKNANIEVVGYFNDDKELVSLLNALSSDVSFLTLEKNVKLPTIIECSSINEEVGNFLNIAVSMIDSGVDINNIKLLRPGEDYQHVLDHLATFFHVEIYDAKRYPLITFPYVREKLNDIFENEEVFNEKYQTFLEETPTNYVQSVLQNLFINTPIQSLNYENYKEIIISKSNNLRINLEEKTNAIEIVDEIDFLNDKNIYFILNFSQGNYPKIASDIALLSDVEREELGLLTRLDKYILNKKKIENIILNAPHIYLSFPSFIGSYKQINSMIATELNLETKSYSHPDAVFSKEYAAFLFSNASDLYNETGEETVYLKAFPRDDFSTIYNTYNNEYNSKILPPKVEGKMTLSYSQINTYFKCPFNYYLTYVLGIRDEITTYYADLGTFVHSVMENISDVGPDYDLRFHNMLDEFAENYNLTSREKGIFANYKNLLGGAILFHNKLIQDMTFIGKYSEENLNYEISQSPKTNFYGRADLIYEVGNRLNPRYVLIDFKTGKYDFNDKYIEDGLDLQLPIYAWLLEKGKGIPVSNIIGIYINHLEDKNSYLFDTEEQERTYHYYEMSLDGITNDNLANLKYFVSEETLKGISKVKYDAKNDLIKGKGAKNVGYFEYLVNIADEKINEANENIRANKFPISPYFVNVQDNACTYCSYRDICFRKKENFRVLEKDEDLGDDV